ncbi:MAG: hypothetical protein AB8B99_24505, partial [Phormidesmis sp.]
QGCERFGPVDDIGFCEECASKFDRDMIRQRHWDYSRTAFLLPNERHEELRTEIIKRYGATLELIAHDSDINHANS